MNSTNPPPSSAQDQPPGWAVLLFFVGFLVWGYIYLFHLRPIFNAWAFQYVGSYPAMVHVFPIIGGPIVVGLLFHYVGKLFKK